MKRVFHSGWCCRSKRQRRRASVPPFVSLGSCRYRYIIIHAIAGSFRGCGLFTSHNVIVTVTVMVARVGGCGGSVDSGGL